MPKQVKDLDPATAPPLPESPKTQQGRSAHVRKVLDWDNHDPAKQLNIKEIATRIIALAQAISEKQFYPYQVEVAFRIVESLLRHDGEVVTALISRQSGKTEVLSSLVAALGLMMPKLAKEFPEDFHLNITDDRGHYRGFREGIKIGIYAPRMDQASIMFERVRHTLETDTGKKVLKELNLKFEESNGTTVRLSNGSRIMCESASEQSKIEGETHNLLVCEEAQDITDMKIRKSLHPMVSSMLGSIVKIGTATTKKCDFYDAIRVNERKEALGGKRNHFFYPHTVCERYNSLYRRYVDQERERLGADSDEFRMAYGCEWIFERGMFVVRNTLLDFENAPSDGIFSIRHPFGLPRTMGGYSHVLGIDWGASSDSTVLTLSAVNWNQPVTIEDVNSFKDTGDFVFYRKHIVDWVEYIGDDYETQFWKIMEYVRHVNRLEKIVTDSNTAGKPMFDRLSAALANTDVEMVDFNFHSRIKSDGYKSFANDIHGRRMTIPCGRNTMKTLEWKKFVSQMLDLQKEYNKGLMRVHHPDEKGAHDDYADSCMMSFWGCNLPKDSTTFETSSSNFFFH